MLHPLRLGVVVNQPIATLRNTVLRHLRLDLVKPCAEEPCPIVRVYRVQDFEEVVKGVGDGSVASVIDSEKQLREIVEGLLSVAKLTDFCVGIKPDEVRFRIIVVRTLPTRRSEEHT